MSDERKKHLVTVEFFADKTTRTEAMDEAVRLVHVAKEHGLYLLSISVVPADEITPWDRVNETIDQMQLLIDELKS